MTCCSDHGNGLPGYVKGAAFFDCEKLSHMA
jgi:hypothetical protein